MACKDIVAIDDEIALEEVLVSPAAVTVISPNLGGLSFDAFVTLVDNDGKKVFSQTHSLLLHDNIGQSHSTNDLSQVDCKHEALTGSFVFASCRAGKLFVAYSESIM